MTEPPEGSKVAFDAGGRRSRPARQSRSAGREATILEAVRRILDRGERASSITIDEICAEADLSRSSFYLRWPSKDAMWADFTAETLEGAVGIVDRTRRELGEVTDVAEFAERMGIAYVTWMFEHRNDAVAMAELVEANPAVADTMNRFTAMMMESIAEEVDWRLGRVGARLSVRSRLEMTRLVEVLLAAVHRAMAYDTRTGELQSMSPEQFTEWFGPMSRGMAAILTEAIDGATST